MNLCTDRHNELSETHHSVTPLLQFFRQLAQQRLRIHHHAEVLVEIRQRRLLFGLRKRRVAVRQNKTLKSRMAPSRAVLSQQTLVATPVMAMVSRPMARRRFSSCVP